MLLTQKMLLMFSPWQLAFMLFGFFALFSAGTFLMTRAIVAYGRVKTHNDVVGPILGVIGTIYAVLLAFIVIVTWENHDVTKQNIDEEIGKLASLSINADAFEQPMRMELRDAIRQYIGSIVDDEWKTLRVGESCPATAMALRKIISVCAAYKPATRTEEIFLEQSVGRVDELYELRRKRQLDSSSGVDPILWMVLILGGIITVTVSCIFDTERKSFHIFTSLSLAIIIAAALFTILELDYPFTGKMSISSAPFQKLLVRLEAYK